MSDAIVELEEYLEGFLNFECSPNKEILWLLGMKELCRAFGNPQDVAGQVRVHVAGSKGKGSVCAMVSSIIEAATGRKCGLYSSPHLLSFLERVRTCHEDLPREIYEGAARKILDKVPTLPPLCGVREPSWFELVTLFAFLCFRNLPYAVYEVGLGGRLDATNVITPAACAITKLEREHTQYLGDTIEKIAYEKAGIIKKGVPVILGSQVYEAATAVVEKVAKESGSPLIKAWEEFSEVGYSLSLNSSGKTTMQVKANSLKFNLSLLGEVQLENALTAITLARTVIKGLKDEDIVKGLEGARLSGRFEEHFIKGIYWVLDGAHTVQSLRGTVSTFRKALELRSLKSATLVFALAKDKAPEPMAAILDGFSHTIITLAPGKDCDLNRIKNALSPHNLEVINNTNKALEKALSIGNPVLVTGSFYLVAAAKRWLGEGA